MKNLSNKALSLQRAKKEVRPPNGKYSTEKRIEVVTQYLALGNMRLVAELTGVSHQLCRMWKREKWWADMVAEVKATRVNVIDTKLSKIVDLSLETIADRLENGDPFFNQKSGKVERKEVSLKDATKVATDVLARQAILQKGMQDDANTLATVSMKDQLANLASEFAKFNRKNTGEVVDAVIVSDGKPAEINEFAITDDNEFADSVESPDEGDISYLS